jgi:hypothetical protein
MIIGLMGQKRVGKDTAGAVIAAELGGSVMAWADPIKRWCMLALNLNEEQLWGKAKEKPLTKPWLKSWSKKTAWLKPRDIGPLPPWADYLADACCVPPHQRGIVGSRAYATLRWWVNDDINREMCVWWEGLRVEPGLTPRRVMQHFGTEFVRRRLGPTFWIDQGLRIADTLLKGGFRYTPAQGLIANEKSMMNAAVFTDVRFRNEVLALRRVGALIYGIERPITYALHPESKTSVMVKAGKEKILLHASEQEQLSVPQFWLDGRFINRFGSKEEFEHTVRYVARHRIATRGPVVY